ncbi:MAG: DsbA family oxidoreductase [Actinomycetales bacterium]|nr:DsbA family oxidoreductase [Actinomycetales bacterium]
MSDGVDAVDALDVQVWADLVCPWCYIAQRRLAAAVAGYAGPVAVRHRAYELDPGMPSGERVPVAEYLGRKYGGGLAAGLAMTERVAAVAAEDGLVLDFARAVKSSTFDAHRLLALAAAEGAGQLAGELQEAMYAAHFRQGLALDDHGVLMDLATGVGLSRNRIGEVLGSDAFAAPVRADEAEARSLGVTGVPFTVAGGRVAVSGAQPVEVFTALLTQAADASGPADR